MDREKAGGTETEKHGVGFLVKEYLCDIVEVIDDTKFDDSVWIRVPGERREGYICWENLYASRIEE